MTRPRSRAARASGCAGRESAPQRLPRPRTPCGAFDRAAELADDDVERAGLLERAGETAGAANDAAASEERLSEARRLFDEAGLSHDAARAAAALSMALWKLGRGEEAVRLLDPALEVLSQDEPDENIARLAAEAGRVHHFQGNDEAAGERIELALEIAERNGYAQVLSDALNTKAILLQNRPNESRALLRGALAIALEHDLTQQAVRAYNNLAVQEAPTTVGTRRACTPRRDSSSRAPVATFSSRRRSGWASSRS